MSPQWAAGAASLRRIAANVGGIAGLVARPGPATHVHLYDERGEVRSLDPGAEPGAALVAAAEALLEVAERRAGGPSEGAGDGR